MKLKSKLVISLIAVVIISLCIAVYASSQTWLTGRAAATVSLNVSSTSSTPSGSSGSGGAGSASGMLKFTCASKDLVCCDLCAAGTGQSIYDATCAGTKVCCGACFKETEKNETGDDVLFSIEVGIPFSHKNVLAGEQVAANIKMLNYKTDGAADIAMYYWISPAGNNSIVLIEGHEVLTVEHEASTVAKLTLPNNIDIGMYTFNAKIMYDGESAKASDQFEVVEHAYQKYIYLLMPVGIIIAVIIILAAAVLLRRKRYSGDAYR